MTAAAATAVAEAAAEATRTVKNSSDLNVIKMLCVCVSVLDYVVACTYIYTTCLYR